MPFHLALKVLEESSRKVLEDCRQLQAPFLQRRCNL